MPAVCRFYIKGYCRYGNNCRFEHPREEDTTTPPRGVGGFSFTKALQEVSPPSNSSQGFSFTRALETAQSSSPFSQQYNQPNSYFGQNNYQQQPCSYFNNSYSFEPPAPRQQQYNQQNFNSTGDFSFNQALQSTIKPDINPLTAFNSSLTSSFAPTGFTPFSSASIDIDIKNCDQEIIEDEPQLTELEIKAYQADKFSFRQVPIRPPPRYLCH